jgi:hypothetical protein
MTAVFPRKKQKNIHNIIPNVKVQGGAAPFTGQRFPFHLCTIDSGM